MTRAEARTAIQALYEDVSGAPTTAELNTWIDTEHKNFRRELESAIPSIYTAVSAEQTLASGSESLTLPSDFERLIRVERLDGVIWLPVDISDALTTQLGDVAAREEGTAIKIGPTAISGATYRLVYVQKPVTLTADSGAGGVLLVPDGCEDIIVERCAARARRKLEEDPTPHEAKAAETWREQKRALRKRYGRQVEPGLRQVRRW